MELVDLIDKLDNRAYTARTLGVSQMVITSDEMDAVIQYLKQLATKET